MTKPAQPGRRVLAFNLKIKELVIFAHKHKKRTTPRSPIQRKTMACVYKGNCYQPGLVLGSLSPPPPPSAWPRDRNCYVSATRQGRPVSHMRMFGCHCGRVWMSGLTRQSCILRTVTRQLDTGQLGTGHLDTGQLDTRTTRHPIGIILYRIKGRIKSRQNFAFLSEMSLFYIFIQTYVVLFVICHIIWRCLVVLLCHFHGCLIVRCLIVRCLNARCLVARCPVVLDSLRTTFAGIRPVRIRIPRHPD